MKIIWTFTLLMIPGVLSSISVTGYSGGGVTITCKYDREYKTNAKYFCKGQWLPTCSELIRTETKSGNKWVQSGRFTLYDNTTAAVFTVTIRGLTEQDSGTYRCGVDTYGSDPSTEVNLKVIKGPQISTVRGYSGGNVIINYRYEIQHKKNEKRFCETGRYSCFTLISINGAAEWEHSGRFSLHDDRSAGLLRVFIRELSVQDSEVYRIIVRVSEDHSFFSEFQLVITDAAACCQKSISLSAAAGGSVNISCKYPQSHTADVKFVCRRSGADFCAEETWSEESRGRKAEGKIQLYDDREEQLLTATISHESPEPSAEYWCGVQSAAGHKSFITRVLIHFTDADVPKITSSPSSSSSSSSSPPSYFSTLETPLSANVSEMSNIPSPFNITDSSLIIPLVLVLLLLIIAALLLLFLHKKHQAKGGDSTSQTAHGNIEAVSNIGCDYEKIKDIRKQLSTNPSGSSTAVYATAQLPTNPSDSCLYSTVLEASGDSQICISSSEDLNYAVVNFRKTPDCPDSDRLRNDQECSEYAAVNHHLTA